MLNISFGLVVFTAVVFFILIAVLNRWLYKPLLGFMTARDESIRRDMEKAKENSSGSEELLKEAQEIIAKAKVEAATIKAEAVNEAKEFAQKKLDEKKAQLASEYEKFKEKLKSEEEELKGVLLSQAPLFREALKAKFSKLQ
ncbi:F0F1 ATP synthase subunit B family protein [Nitrosophilus labii]|uniref:F0F1 ATP synthase subunit B family protein n=1 Tax=Nitrosophilus labii TaxID=2706014 RepID=UPI0016572E51|nr:F0F1 ATP synthase subunit B' [Nitrosophilus labii]